ncbi:glycosyl hydrolase 115 family protein [Hymenobacter monticola]|uniref:Glycosyl hydrolase 115 family protein n=1 Tax=Hymenobacter monticola TaxID=1705399 RepID=A0ABY4AZW5_9BACT|nr:glycosyl hydrolase 115 family protein [Hymenobacter monticola]UOE32451.1 glycosyl hydrolase 115 family protein [Hymenobacter monticola]
MLWSGTAWAQSYLAFDDKPAGLVLAADGNAIPLLVSPEDHKGVLRAATDLQHDFQLATGTQPKLLQQRKQLKAKEILIIGTIGKSQLIDQLARRKKLDVSQVQGKWEASVTQTIDKPFPGVARALVIAGSDKRGTIYGIYELSKQLGVSPWYWWADVPVVRHATVAVRPGTYLIHEPAVKYRGIFINDEAPAFSGWAKAKFGGANHQTYEHMFELILRLRGNYLWPAMWGNAFNDDDKLNPVKADEYGVVMGTSHHEPMVRSQKEWERYGKGPWNYETNPVELQKFWRQGIENMGAKESIITMGMRGDGDVPMSAGTNIKLLESIVRDQRTILADVTKRPVETIPQLWALYTEVQQYYDQGMRVPDDVTLLLCDDNYGNIRRLPKPTAPKRSGGYGLYYHFDFNGGPWSYKWINSSQLTKVWEQLHQAYAHGVDRIWIMNVGDLKPLEVPISFYFEYAWDPSRLPAEQLPAYTRQWAGQQFGPALAQPIGDLLTTYSNYSGIRKPDLLSTNTFSLINYQEFEQLTARYHALRDRALQVQAQVPAPSQDAYFEVVQHPIQALTNLLDLHLALAKNKWYAAQGRAAANSQAAEVRRFYVQDSLLSYYYNHTLAGGKWEHMMDQPHVFYRGWRGPDREMMPATLGVTPAPAPEMAVSVEGSTVWWPQAKEAAVLPELNAWQRQPHYLEVFNRGQGSFAYTATSTVPWLKIDQPSGTVAEQERLWLSVDWAVAPAGQRRVPVTLSGPGGQRVVVQVPIDNRQPQAALPGKGHVEGNGYVSISGPHYSRAVQAGATSWQVLENYGRTSTGITLVPGTAPRQEATASAPHLEYQVQLHQAGPVKLRAYLTPTIDFNNAGGLVYAVAFDDEAPQLVNISEHRPGEAWVNDNAEKAMMDNIRTGESAHQLAAPGVHTLKFWVITPGIVLQKLVLDTGGLKDSYLGPPESFRKE